MTKTIPLMQLTLVLGLGLATAACQTVSDAADSVGGAISDLNPFGSDDNAPPPPAADAGTTSTDTNTATTPDLANLPSPPVSSTTAQQQATAQSLAADGAQARYSADNLRAGTEAAAPPPAAADVPPSAVAVASASPPPGDAPPSAGAPPPSAEAVGVQPPSVSDTAPSASVGAQPPSASDAAPSASVGTQPPSASETAPAAADTAPPSASTSAMPPSAQSLPTAAASAPSAPSPILSQGTAAVPVGPSSAPVQTAALAPMPSAMSPSAAIPPGAEPAVPANTPVRGAVNMMSSQTTSDAALGFKPSSAPPLDASINQWVSAPIVAHYRQTASIAGVASTSNAAVPPRGTPMPSGAVVANLDGGSTGPTGSIAAMNGGVTPTAVIYFPGDGTSLSAAARAQIRSAVAQYKATGGDASVRVVGHASSRTANMSIEKHLEVIFDKSQARANAVAQELIHEGIPAAKVLVEAVGDSQPIYYESMPQGEDGNRRAEIFVQG